MNSAFNREKPFEYLRRKDGSAFPTETVRNWYIARAYVLDRLKNVAFCPTSEEHLQVVVTQDTPLMLAVVRQVALSAHYINYDETDGKNRTVIVLISSKDNIFDEIRKEESLNLLPDFCKCSVYGSEIGIQHTYIDIELRIVRECSEEDRHNSIVMSEEDVRNFIELNKDVFSIDTRKAVLADRIYGLGTVIDNMPAENIHSARRYSMALDYFQYNLLQKKIQPLICEDWEKSQILVRRGLSNIFCADCFETRAQEIEKCSGNGKHKEQIWEENNEALSKTEHIRWVVSMLVMGVRPLNIQERIRSERMFGEEKKQYWKKLATLSFEPAHLDLCSYAELRRINPDDLKYDSFLMLAIPSILEKLAVEDKKQRHV